MKQQRMNNFNHDDLDYVVQCKWPGKWFENIAAFNVKLVAECYAAECQETNPQFEYRVVCKETK